MSELSKRLLSAAVLIAGGFAALALDVHARWALLTATLCVGAWELSRLAGRKFALPRAPWLPWIPALAVFALCLPAFPGWTAPEPWAWGVALATLSALIAAAFARLPVTVVAPWIALNGFFVAYLGVWGAAVFALFRPETGWAGVAPFAYTMACIAAADTGAYFTGRAFGKRKLAPELSKGKTREGAVGGLLASVLVSLAFAAFEPSLGLSPAAAVALGAVLALASVAGDLFISAFKRWALAKDTSNLIPGHGGVMDRFDALVFAAPFAWMGMGLLG